MLFYHAIEFQDPSQLSIHSQLTLALLQNMFRPKTHFHWYHLSLGQIPDVQQWTHVRTHDQEQSSYHGLINYSLSVELSLTACDHTPLRYNHKAKRCQLSMSNSDMPVVAACDNHKAKCFSSNVLHSAVRLGTDIHLATAVPDKDNLIPRCSVYAGSQRLAPRHYC